MVHYLMVSADFSVEDRRRRACYAKLEELGWSKLGDLTTTWTKTIWNPSSFGNSKKIARDDFVTAAISAVIEDSEWNASISVSTEEILEI